MPKHTRDKRSRSELLKTARQMNNRGPIDNKGEADPELLLVSRFSVVGRPLIERSSHAAVGRVKEIARGGAAGETGGTIRGELSFDSWQGMPAVALRDAGPGCERRLRLTAGRFELDIVAERGEEEWEFIARVYEKGRVLTGFALKAGRRKIVASSQGFFHWQCKRPPQRLVLQSPAMSIDFGAVSWQALKTG